MRRFRIPIAIAAAAALGLWVYFAEIRGGRRREDRRDREARLFDFPEQAVLEVRIERPAGKIVLRRRTPGAGWDLVEPVAAPATASAADEIVSAAIAARVERDLGTEAQAPATYGLDPPERRLTLAGEGRDVTLEIGAASPNGASAYARRPGGPVLLVPARLRDAALLEADELRDLRLLLVGPESITGLRIERSGDLPIELERGEGGDWRIVDPVRADADDLEVDKLREDLERARADLVVAESADDPAAYGFDTPTVRLRARLRDGASPVLVYGSAVPPDRLPELLRTRPVGGGLPPAPAWKLYARREIEGAPPGPVVVADGEIVKRLSWPLYKFREIRALRLNRWKVNRVRLEFDGLELRLEEDEERRWRAVHPAAREVAWDEVEPLLDAMFEMRIRQFFPGVAPAIRAGLDAPRLLATVEDSREKRSAILRVGPPTGDGRMAFVEAEDSLGIILEGEALLVLREARRIHALASASAAEATGAAAPSAPTAPSADSP